MNLASRSTLPSLLACALLLVGCPGDDTGDEGASTHEPGTTEHGTAEHGTAEHGTAEHGTTEHGTDEHGTTEHGTDEHGTAEHGTDEHGTDEHGTDTSAEDPAAVYCDCVFTNCHEPYHAKWGEDEMMSEAACLMEASALPVNGSDIDMGNFIECRQHFCDLAASDETLCANALGDAVCI